MNLLEYIKMSYLRPNKAVLQGLGASNDLIEYLLETPNNMNINVIGGLMGQSSSDGVVLYDGIGEVAYQSELNIGTVQTSVDSLPSVLNNIQEGTTFKVEVDGEIYNFTIAQVMTGPEGFMAASFVGDIVSAEQCPVFMVQFEIQDDSAVGAFAFGVEGPIDKETVNIKITQTSDYEDLITGPYHLTIDFNGGTYGENHLTTLTLDTDYYSNDIVDLDEILLDLKSNINSPGTGGKVPPEPRSCSLQSGGVPIQNLRMNDNKTVYILYGASMNDGTAA